MKMNSHPHGEQLSAYLDGMLDVGQIHAIASHLAVCPECQATQEGLRHTKHLLSTLSSPDQPDAEFWANAYRRMRVETAQKPSVLPNISWEYISGALSNPQRRWSAGLVAAAAVVGLIFAPLASQGPGVIPPHVNSPVTAPDFVDVSALMQAHTETAAHEPLADADRQDVIALDNSFAADDIGQIPADAVDTASDASSP